MSKCYKDETGRKLIVSTGTTLTGKTVSLIVRKPSGTEVEWAGAVGVDATTIEYTIASGALDEVGVYTLQAKIVSGGTTSYGEAVQFRVYQKYEP